MLPNFLFNYQKIRTLPKKCFFLNNDFPMLDFNYKVETREFVNIKIDEIYIFLGCQEQYITLSSNRLFYNGLEIKAIQCNSVFFN